MKVYELMDKLAEMPAGARVVFHRLAEKSEILKYQDTPSLYQLDFEIRDVQNEGGDVALDGWAE